MLGQSGAESSARSGARSTEEWWEAGDPPSPAPQVASDGVGDHVAGAEPPLTRTGVPSVVPFPLVAPAEASAPLQLVTPAAAGSPRPPRAGPGPFGTVDAADAATTPVALVSSSYAAAVGGAVAAFSGAAVAGIAAGLLSDGRAVAATAAAAVLLVVGVVTVVHLARRVRREVDEPLADLRDSLRDPLAATVPAPSAEGPVSPLLRDHATALAVTRAEVESLRRKAEWGDQSRMIFEALELAADEVAVHTVVDRALALIDAARPVELLAAPSGSQRLQPVSHNPSVEPPACPVDSIDSCLALRRGQTVVADSSESINSCPHLKGRPGGPCSAVCVPVTLGGQPTGVLHAVAADRHPPDQEFVGRLGTLAGQVGNRFAALRALEKSREEAATDGLTGLPNRRFLEAEVEQLLASGVPFVLVLADLDRFKRLNDTYGHEAGDQALQVFAEVLRDNVRDRDVVARIGGEEFVVVYPRMSVARSIEAIERLRNGLAVAIESSGVRHFTSSYGVTHSSVGNSVGRILRVADAGLLRAKSLGGDQMVYADEQLASEVFSAEATADAATERDRIDLRR